MNDVCDLIKRWFGPFSANASRSRKLSKWQIPSLLRHELESCTASHYMDLNAELTYDVDLLVFVHKPHPTPMPSL